MESVSDLQKYRFRSNPANKGRTCTVGLFSWSRHPNYFGEILVQFSIFMIAVSPSAYGYIPKGSGAYAAQYAAILGPILLTVLLMFISGLTLQERPGAKKKYEIDGPGGPAWKAYETWLDRTSILIPLPPALYKGLPAVVKRTVLLEWGIYRFDPEKHADQKKVGERQAEEGEAEGGESGSGSGDAGRRGSGDGIVNGTGGR